MRRSSARDLLLRRAERGAVEAGGLLRRVDCRLRRARCGGLQLAQTQVLVHAARKVAQASVEDRELLVGDALEEVPVVAHDQQGARPRVEQILDRGEHVGVEIVGRLVEDQHVGLVEEHEQQLQTALLPTGEVLDRRRELRRVEAEPLEQLSGRQFLRLGSSPHRVRGAQPRDHDAHRLAAHVLELVEALGEGLDLHRRAALHAADGRLDGAGDESEQRRLASAVDTEDAGALTRGDAPLDVAEHHSSLVRPSRSTVG